MPPPGLPSLILYDFFKWRTAQKSHENFRNICASTKIPEISLEEYVTNFHEVLKENYHRKLDFRDLAKIDNLKLCILSDVLDRKSIEKSYTDISETFGAENIDYSDFDFWFYRFYWSLDPKPLEFANLPVMIHHKIIDNLDLGNQLTLRSVSKSLKNILDQGKPAIKSMKITVQLDNFSVIIDDSRRRYSMRLDEDSRESALNYVTTILKNPKLRLDSLHIISQGSTDPFFVEFFNSLEDKIWTKYLYLNVNCPQATTLFLACVNPKFLEILDLIKGNIEEISQLDQWKCLDQARFYPDYDGPMNYFLGLPVFSIKLRSISEPHILQLKERLSISENFKSCVIESNQAIQRDLIEQVFSLNPDYIHDGDDNFQRIGYSYAIPNSGNVLKMTVFWDQLTIEMDRSP
ncbi:unnamed protein product [Caenorhabditis nigoni]